MCVCEREKEVQRERRCEGEERRFFLRSNLAQSIRLKRELTVRSLCPSAGVYFGGIRQRWVLRGKIKKPSVCECV